MDIRSPKLAVMYRLSAGWRPDLFVVDCDDHAGDLSAYDKHRPRYVLGSIR